jgi:SAM-dependent methyltransferase
VTADDPTGWFERLYAAAAAGAAEVPWERGGPHPLLAEWARGRDGAGRRALVVGARLGDDAELLAAAGFDVVAFDISPTAIQTARERFPGSRVGYRTADLLDPPAEWREAFDLVVEVFTVQSLPEPHRARAIANVAGLVAPGGTLVVVAAAREPDEAADGPPWPLTRAEIDAFATGGLEAVRVEDLRDVPEPGARRWRAELRRPAPIRCSATGRARAA